MTRDEHVAWAKQRAREYVELGDLAGAVTSMISDMGKREDTKPPAALGMIGLMAVREGRAAVTRWIEGFN